MTNEERQSLWPMIDREMNALRLRIQVLEAQRAMTVARLGGTVEGQPTSELNYLQRVDELVGKECRLRSISMPINAADVGKVYCDRCDGTGAVEGGKVLLTLCEKCNGTGLLPKGA